MNALLITLTTLLLIASIIIIAKLTSRLRKLDKTFEDSENRMARTQERARRAEKELAIAKKETTLDPLTRLYNYSFFNKRLKEEINRLKRHHNKQSLQVLFIDLDYFKEYNEIFGHEAADRALVEIAVILKEKLRSYDIAARRSGDEFLVLLTEKDEAAAHVVAQKIIDEIEKIDIRNKNFRSRLSASIGISSFDLLKPEQNLIDLADGAMYKAKKEGKGKVIISELKSEYKKRKRIAYI